MREIWESLLTGCRDYFSGSGFGLLFAVCLLFLLIRNRQRRTRNALLWPTLLLLAVIFCPLTAGILMKLIGDGVYWRSFWMLPIVPVIAYVAVEASAMMRGRVKQVLAAAVCLAVIALNGTFVFSDTYFSDRQNNYKLPTEVIWVADAINEHAAGQGITGKKKKIVAPTGISTYIRIYDASIRQRYGRGMTTGEHQSELFLEINSETPDFEHLAARVKKAKSRYVVLMASADDETAMNALKFEKIYESPSYAVYFNLRYQKK